MNCPRCGKPVDEHEAGRETDACFAEVVMGHTVHYIDEVGGAWWGETDGPGERGYPLRHYSTDIAAAWEGLEQMQDKYWSQVLLGKEAGAGPHSAECEIGLYLHTPQWFNEAPTASLAIVRACLKAKLAEKEADDELS